MSGESVVAPNDLHVNSGFPDPAIADSMVLNGGLFHSMLEIYTHFALHKPRLESL